MSMKALCHASCPSTTHPWLSPGAGVPVSRGSCVVPSRPRKGPLEPLPPCIPSLLPLLGLKHGLNPLSSAPGGPEAGGGGSGGGTYIGQLGWAPPAAHCSGGGQGGPFPSGVSPGASPFVCLAFLVDGFPTYRPSSSQLCPQDLLHPCHGQAPAQALDLSLPPRAPLWMGRPGLFGPHPCLWGPLVLSVP